MDKERYLFEASRPKDPEIELQMEHRLFNAKELGRICPEENPDFIGNFYELDKARDYVSRPSGIFELTINKKEDNGDFEGIIKDCFGNAIIKGNITDVRINFLKHYISEESSVKASSRDIFYSGFWDPPSTADFIGEWRYDGSRNPNGMFWLSKDITIDL